MGSGLSSARFEVQKTHFLVCNLQDILGLDRDEEFGQSTESWAWGLGCPCRPPLSLLCEPSLGLTRHHFYTFLQLQDSGFG